MLEWHLLQKNLKGVAVLEHQCEIGTVEIWKDIRGYEGFYQVSNFGRVKSLSRLRNGKNGGKVPLLEKIMKPYRKKPNARTRPYEEIQLRKNQVRDTNSKSHLVHRLVADAFIKNLEPDEQVDHINGIHFDNRAENLRVMKTIEHARLHPTVLNPNPRNAINGQYIKKLEFLM